MRKALAIGADKAVRIDMCPNDSYSTAFEISKYLNQNPADIIITGKESSDYNGGAVGGMSLNYFLCRLLALVMD